MPRNIAMYTPKELFWRDEMTTGVVELDAQHKYLINFFNDLGHSIKKKYDPEDISKVLKVMKYYADWHFHKEDECMARYHCPAAEKNTKAHAIFMEKLQEYQKEYEQSGGSIELAIKIHEELANWIVNHIMAIDTQLHPCIPA
jgi:hemerythrin